MFWKWRCLLQKPAVTLLTVGAPAKLWSLAVKIITVKWRNTTPTAPHCNYILILRKCCFFNQIMRSISVAPFLEFE